jgi:hypothetical protein
MSSFSDRTQKAEKLERPFISTLDEICETHRIVKFGMESTDVKKIHDDIRKAYDVSSRFVRYLPDSVIVRIDDNGIGPKTALIEFKVQDTLVEYDSFFGRIKTEYYQERKRPEDPELIEKPQIFEVEKDALDIYNDLATKLEVVVIIIGWQTPTDKLIAQYANKIVVCHEWIPSKEKRDSGSGTTIYNTHIDSYEPLDVFCRSVFGIQDDVLDAIMRSIRR